MILQLEMIPVLLNKLYIPIIRNGKPSIIKSKDAKEFVKYVQMECLRQRIKPIKGDVSFHMDVLIDKRKSYDIDATLKLLFDSLNKVAYEDDERIVELIVRKHRKAERDALIIKIEGVE